jgi:hypothetical protein
MVNKMKRYLEKIKEIKDFELKIEYFTIEEFSFRIETRGNFIEDKFICYQVEIYQDSNVLTRSLFNNFNDLQINLFNRLLDSIKLQLPDLLSKITKLKALEMSLYILDRGISGNEY